MHKQQNADAAQNACQLWSSSEHNGFSNLEQCQANASWHIRYIRACARAARIHFHTHTDARLLRSPRMGEVEDVPRRYCREFSETIRETMWKQKSIFRRRFFSAVAPIHSTRSHFAHDLHPSPDHSSLLSSFPLSSSLWWRKWVTRLWEQ